MYRFKGKPNMLVKSKRVEMFNNKVDYKPLFRFDNDGFYFTDDEKLIERLKGRFDYVKIEEDTNVSEDEEKALELITEFEKDISELSYQELRKLAKEKGIEFEKAPKKEKLLEVLNNG